MRIYRTLFSWTVIGTTLAFLSMKLTYICVHIYIEYKEGISVTDATSL